MQCGSKRYFCPNRRINNKSSIKIMNLLEFFLGATFPGVVVHELGHILFCKLTRTKIKKFSLFQPFMPLGYVVHEKPSTLFREMLIVLGPFILNSFLAIFMIQLLALFSLPIFFKFIVIWLIFSFGFHAFPSQADAKSFYLSVKNEIKNKKITLLYLPIALFFNIMSSSRVLTRLIYPLILLGINSKLLADIID